MGGTQKKPISTLEKRVKEEDDKGTKKEKKQKGGGKAASTTMTSEQVSLKRASEEIQKQKAVTPYELSAKLNVSISAAKELLRQLEKQGTVKLLAKNRRTAVYVAA
ncbi:30S ribosomal protein S25e [Sulfodiicoccus acidiphilus]|uniref:30S ribosomal protein S25e n=1 Tax=Sulfodiicoccus acidiphilus TaxID=1670455 RepID=A0A348B759_9CREN|nr:30S ribosomal protein S25e [Sulfodiicoccus acidiphilus]BBD74011.1 30S ribosomal protein S25e [Sulfodiicoccus acidiphilus]GGT87179.1 30S ribosomal protein S25e [Sulfodiicoccus acidiphilus]